MKSSSSCKFKRFFAVYTKNPIAPRKSAKVKKTKQTHAVGVRHADQIVLGGCCRMDGGE